MKTLTVLACLALNVSTLADVAPRQGIDVIGEEIRLGSPRVAPAHRGGFGRAVRSEAEATPELVWSTRLYFTGADYIAPHFSKFDLPPGAFVVVRSEDGTASFTFNGRGKDVPDPSQGFWGGHVYGETAVVELHSDRPLREGSVAIDRYARGYSEGELAALRGYAPLSLCGADDSLWAKCYQSTEAAAYSKSRAVARLMINGTGACTGWLVGSEGHVLTNQHCILSASDAANTDVELMAEGGTCSTSCGTWGGCPGTVVATSSTLIKNSAAYDYALMKMPSNPTGTYGYMQMRGSGAVQGERIYIPQHPQAWGKKIAMTAGTGNATVTTLNASPCSGSGYTDVGYMADTQGGSSGSPVVGYSDHNVVALHHCGGCPNIAVPIQKVIADLGALVPANAVAGGTPPPTDSTPPSTPTGLSAKGTKAKITLAWSAATDNVGVTSYQVYRSASASGPFTALGTSTGTSYTDNVASKSTWSYRVSAKDAAGNESGQSATATGSAK